MIDCVAYLAYCQDCGKTMGAGTLRHLVPVAGGHRSLCLVCFDLAEFEASQPPLFVPDMGIVGDTLK